jgi:hypothetical protein
VPSGSTARSEYALGPASMDLFTGQVWPSSRLSLTERFSRLPGRACAARSRVAGRAARGARTSQTSDAYLVKVAALEGRALDTVDTDIPGATLIR